MLNIFCLVFLHIFLSQIKFVLSASFGFGLFFGPLPLPLVLF
jgi:hypothetical protein